jgi:hypothetical protein
MLVNSPDFNIDKTQTPMRILAPNPQAVLFEWGWFAASKRLAKPVDMVMLRDGVHLLEKPWDRIVSQQGDVDWFAFGSRAKKKTPIPPKQSSTPAGAS